MPLSKPRYLNSGCKMLLSGISKGHVQSIGCVVILVNVHLEPIKCSCCIGEELIPFKDMIYRKFPYTVFDKSV